MNIGDKFILANHAPYSFGVTNKKEVTFITVEVVQKHEDAKGEFTGKVGTGYTALGSDGYTYSFNYPHINEGFSNTAWIRYMPDEEFSKLSTEDKEKLVEDYLWLDVTNFQCPAKAVFAINNDFIEYCESHQRHFYTRKGCFYCKHMPDYRPEIEFNMEEHRWIGWYQ